ncbi:hypothetical protein [Paraburkholderia rhynchosiae]|uniref:hypothetical protein n=1 Tax=Paraburkholderia rhynchosiae TaxID=487049 RepID=UPI001304BDFE|nr:hypothetical protein [Paraburkholderia rhynchosiae]
MGNPVTGPAGHEIDVFAGSELLIVDLRHNNGLPAGATQKDFNAAVTRHRSADML